MYVHRIMIMAILLVTMTTATAGWAQETAPNGATGEPEKTTAAEPSTDDALSDEETAELKRIAGEKGRIKSWDEFVADWMTPQPFPKNEVLKIDEEYAYPHIVASIKMKIVREDDDYVWLVGISPEDPDSPLYKIWARREADQALHLDQQELMRTPGAVNFVDFAAEEVPPPFAESLTFEAVTGGLPTAGRWQMGFAVADMNEDGHPDLVFPPRRKGYPVIPVIFLGDGLGGFRLWNDAKFPSNVPWDYGGVAAADLDGDGHQDLVFAIHFKTEFVLYGDGQGVFGRGDRLPSPDQRITSRAVTIADFDGDGKQDLAFVAEVDYDLTTNAKIESASTVWVLFNRVTGWELSHEGLPKNLIADVIRAVDIDGDSRPELVVSTNTLGLRRLVYSLDDDDGWQPAEHRGILSAAYHYDVEPAEGGLYATFVQFRHWSGSTQARNGLVRYLPANGDEEFVIGRPLVWDKQRDNVFFRLAVGDIDGDGRADLAAARRGGGLEVYLQTSDGGFVKEQASELDSIGRAFDIRLIDLDGDGRDDLVAACVPQGDRPGGVHVWLTRPSD